MDIASIVYRSADVDIPERPDIHIDENAELEKPRPQPLRQPRSATPNDDDIVELGRSSPELHAGSSAKSEMSIITKKRKHESFDLSGSVFLVSREGKTLDLPIPSDSRHDPLRWSRWKTGAALVAVGWYSATALTAVQACSLMIGGILPDFTEEVSSSQCKASWRTWRTLT